eukprot:jgi/Bigna1/129769/aug1.9_g4477
MNERSDSKGDLKGSLDVPTHPHPPQLANQEKLRVRSFTRGSPQFKVRKKKNCSKGNKKQETMLIDCISKALRDTCKVRNAVPRAENNEEAGEDWETAGGSSP